jgi:hypothetical protein
MKTWRIIGFILIMLSLSCFLSSCGSESTDLVAGGGIGGTGYISSGTITAFGSVVVNGVTFDTTEASVFVGGQEKGVGNQAILNYLDLGQMVLVEGTANEEETAGLASRVLYMPNVIGHVASIEDVGLRAKRLRVLEQTIIADGHTIVKPGDLEALKEDNLIEVSGLVNDEGVIRATYIRKLANSFDPEIEIGVKGSIQNLNLATQTFQINSLTIYYGKSKLADLTEEEMGSGLWVYVRGKIRNGYMEASEVIKAYEARITNAEWVNLEAFITEFSSDADFKVGLVRAKIHEHARFENGERADLRKGIKIRIRGRITNKILVAQRIYIYK